MRRTISIGDNILDSRDIEERMSELEDSEDEDEIAELKMWQEFKEEGANSEWPYGQIFIHERYFEDYARELADDIGAIDLNASWPLNCIDWEKAARELQYDYYCVDINDEEYWTRS